MHLHFDESLKRPSMCDASAQEEEEEEEEEEKEENFIDLYRSGQPLQMQKAVCHQWEP